MNVSSTANSRKGIIYGQTAMPIDWRNENELSLKNQFIGVGDDWGAWIDFPPGFRFRYFGGFLSAEYNRVWICANGFVSFDPSNSTSPIPTNIPTAAAPNAIISVVWTDLVIDGSASIVTGLFEFVSKREFVIIWKNALHKASVPQKRLTFQVALKEMPGDNPANLRFSQSEILMSYQSVSSIDSKFAHGIADQEGYKGNGDLSDGDFLGNLNGRTLRFYQPSNDFILKSLTIEFYDSNVDSNIDIFPNDVSKVEGYHLKYQQTPTRDPDLRFFKAGKYEPQDANLASANHLRLGDVKMLFKNSDNQYVELTPGEQVTLQFTAPRLQEDKRDFIIILEGHYFRIN